MKRSVGLLVAALSLLAGLAQAREEFEPWQESDVSLPAAPRESALVEFTLPTPATHRFFIDTSSLALGADEVLRFVMVITTASGVRNVTFEGIRCETWERKIYAVGRVDGSWRESVNERWLPIALNPFNRHHAVLAKDYFCDHRVPVREVKSAVEALRAGPRY